MPDDVGSAKRRRVVTSIDLARAVGVSQSTVSLVISGKADGRVSPETQRAVREAAGELGYVPNASARVLRGEWSRLIALAVPNVENEYFGKVLLSAEHAARAQNMAVVLIDMSSDPEWVERLIAMYRAQLLAGAIVYAGSSGSTARLNEALEHVLLVECGAPASGGAIELDIPAVLDQVVQHLFALGHRRIGHARAHVDRHTFLLRSAHLRASLAARDVAFNEAWEYRSSFAVAEATAAAREFLLNTDVTAIFCDDDIIAANVYRAGRELGIEVPRDLSVIGFNDMDIARYLSPELTSVEIDALELGRRAIDKLITSTRGGALATEMLPLRLNVRQSTGPPRRRASCVPSRRPLTGSG